MIHHIQFFVCDGKRLTQPCSTIKHHHHNQQIAILREQRLIHHPHQSLDLIIFEELFCLAFCRKQLDPLHGRLDDTLRFLHPRKEHPHIAQIIVNGDVADLLVVIAPILGKVDLLAALI